MKKKLMTALLSLAIAFGLWVYVVSVVAPDSERTYYDVPVKLHGSNILESRGFMLLSTQDLRLDLELSGIRTDLNQLSSSNITIVADLTSINSAGEHTVPYSVSYPGSISSGITVLSPEKQTITVVVAEWAKKEVPIEVDYDESDLPAGYIVDGKEQLSRNTVTISGVKEVVEKIEKATVSIDLEGRTSDLDQMYELTFRDSNGHSVELVNATADAEKVTVVMKITMIKTIDIKVEVQPGGGLTAADATVAPNFDQLVVSGPASTLEDLDEIKFTVDLAELKNSQTLIFDIKLPNGVTNVTGLTQVAVEVTIPAMTTRTFDILMSQFQLINVPENMEAVITTPRLAVTVSGREHILNALRTENIHITIDLSKMEDGKCEATVEIIGVDNVTVISTYSVKVVLTPTVIPPEE